MVGYGGRRLEVYNGILLRIESGDGFEMIDAFVAFFWIVSKQ